MARGGAGGGWKLQAATHASSAMKGAVRQIRVSAQASGTQRDATIERPFDQVPAGRIRGREAASVAEERATGIRTNYLTMHSVSQYCLRRIPVA